MMRFVGRLPVWAMLMMAAAFVAPVWAQVEPGAVEPVPAEPVEPGDEAPAPVVEQVPGGPKPVAVVDSLIHDFGDEWMSEALEHAFTIRNDGDAPLKIIKVKPSCGCTAAGKHPDEIAPGESGKFPFRLNTSKLNGRFTKAITVSTNDPANSQIRLTLTGMVKQLVDMQPRVAQFNRVEADSVMTRKITITNNTEEKLELSIANQDEGGCFKGELAEVIPGKQFELTVTAQPPFKPGYNRFSMELVSNINKQEKLVVQCMANMPKRLELRSDYISYSPTAKTQSIQKVWFTNNGETPVTVLSAESPDDQLQVAVTEVAAGKRYQITATIPPNYQAEEGAAIVLKTDDAERPEMRIPLRSSRSTQAAKPPKPAEELLGKPAPTQAVTAQGGTEVQIGGESEDVQVVVFYASWCGFCKRALPKFEALNREFKESGKAVEFIAVNMDDRSGRRARTEEQTLEHYQSLELTMPLVLDSGKGIGQPFKVTSFPTTFVVGKTGTVEAVHVGAKQDFEKVIAAEVDTLLAGKTRADFPAEATAAGAATPEEVMKLNPTTPGAAPAATPAEGKTVVVPASDKSSGT